MGARKKFTPEFKREAVQLLERGSRPASELARELGVRRNQLYKWQREFQARGAGAFPGSGARKERTTEITRLKRELAHVTEERDILKKSGSVLRQGCMVKYGFIQTHQQEFRLTRMCRVLQVSRSGYYAWQRRGPSARTQANQQLLARMRILHQQTREAYGARKMWQLLTREGLVCGRHRVARLRRLAGIVALRRRRYVRTVQVHQHETPASPIASTNSLPSR
jgi:transposase/putative transposase